jgi:hypothetical protein
MKIQCLRAGVAAVCAAAIVGIPSVCSAQECPQLLDVSKRSEFGQEPYRVEVAGEYAYLTDAYYSPLNVGFTPVGWHGGKTSIIDVSDPEGPRIVARRGLRYFAFDASGRLMFDVNDGLTIVDVSDAADPVVLSSSFQDQFGASPIAVAGDLAYVPTWDGFEVINVTDPVNPFEEGRIDIEWTHVPPSDIVVEENLAFVTDPGYGVHIVDVTDPSNPHQVGSWQPALDILDLAASGGFAYAACGIDGLRIIDATAPASPVELDSPGPFADVWAVSVEGSLIAVAAGNSGVGVLDISNPARPETLSVYSTDGPVWDVALAGGAIHVAVGTDGESSPPLIRDSEPPFDSFYGGFGGFRIVNVSSPRQPVELASFGLEARVQDVAVKDGLIYEALGDPGLYVGPPLGDIGSFPGNFDTPGFAAGVTPHDHYALVADLHKGLRVIDVSDPFHLVEVGSIDTPGEAHEVAVSDERAYVADGSSGLRVINISSPENPVEIGAVDTPGDAIGVAVSGDMAYIADVEGGFRIIDVSNPAQPVDLDIGDGLHDARAVAVADELVYVISRWPPYGVFSQLFIFDVSNPGDPDHVPTNEVSFVGDPTDIALSGSFAFVTTSPDTARGLGELAIVDISNFYELERVGSWRASKPISGIWIAGGAAHLAAGTLGVPILDIGCLTTYWIDIVAHQPGLYGTEWRSDVIINNEHRRRDVYFKSEPGDPYSVDFILHTADGVLTSEGAVVPEGQGVFEDIVELFDYQGIGALEIRTGSPMSVSSRVYTESEDGTIGAFAQAYRSSDSLGATDAGWLYGLRQVAGEYRTNISVTNTGDHAHQASIMLYRTDGTYLTGYSLFIGAGMVVQSLQPFATVANQPNLGWGFAKVEGEGMVASATVIDSRTNDTAAVRMVKEGPDEYGYWKSEHDQH